MKLYKAKLYQLNPKIPFCGMELYEICRNYIGYYNLQLRCFEETIYDSKYSIFLNDGEPAMLFVKDLVVTPKFFGKVQEILTGMTFFRMQKINIRWRTLYAFNRANQRLYVELGNKLTSKQVKEVYEKLTPQQIQEEIQYLLSVKEEQQQFWNPLPTIVESEEVKSTRQYVKMIEQMRKDI